MKIDNFKTTDGPFQVSGQIKEGIGVTYNFGGVRFALITNSTQDLRKLMTALGMEIDMNKSMPLGFAPLKAFSKP